MLVHKNLPNIGSKTFLLRKVQRTSKRYVQRMLKCCARDMQDVFGMCKECSKDVQGMIYRFFIRTCKEYMCKKWTMRAQWMCKESAEMWNSSCLFYFKFCLHTFKRYFVASRNESVIYYINWGSKGTTEYEKKRNNGTQGPHWPWMEAWRE